ncbi:phage tail length tape measure family protein [Sphingomonas sp. KR1UV-12]|uniref:Phage tail length tape measure family protein n=1 Tax=Sphingomonas aurea TaxID=3063994 RepID=A0ABT9EHV9_9SPHN|nr:phage tail length tape measure family protein [Sphingomonas sp. KR1UV-12]MDP1026398.1 phage tail length tape measure family protein [Sphingomonas sp. KR1UV-12]
MSVGAPALEVGLDIVTTNSMGEIEQVRRAFNEAAGEVIAGASNMERATTNVVRLGSSIAEFRALGTEATRTDAAVKRSAEQMTFALNRSIAEFGKSRAELRDIRAEMKAAAADDIGLAGVAAELRAAAATLGELEQGQRRAANGFEMFEAHARKMAQAARDAAEAEALIAREANQVRAALDPMFLAQQKFDTEMERADRLLAAGALHQREYAQEVQRARDALNQHARLVGGATGGTNALDEATRRLGVTQRFTASEVLNLSRQFQDIGVTAAMGMNPLMILVQQGPQIYDVLEQAKARGVSAGAALKQMGSDAVTYGVTGFGRLAAFITPANLAMAGTAVAAMAVARSIGSYGAAIQQFEASATGLGRASGQTAEQLEAISEAAATLGNRSLSGARDSVNAFVAAGIQGSATLTMLAADVDRYAKLTGQDAPAAQAALAEAIKDPARAADTFTQQLGLLTGAQYEHIRQLAAMGEGERAAAELTRILSRDLAANATETTGLAHYMDLLGATVAGVSTMFGRLDQRIKAAGASYDAWLKRNVGGWAVDLLGTGNKEPGAGNANAGRNQDQIAALNASQSLNTTGMRQYNELLAQQRVLQRGLADTTGLTGQQVQALRHDYAAVTDTINANRTASGQWISTQERAHMIAEAQTRLAGARTQAEKAAAQRQIKRLELGTQVLTQQERETQALDAYNRVADKYVKPKTDRRAETLFNEAKATEAQIRNTYALADAYTVSGAASLVAEARVKAESAAIRKRGDVEAFVDRQVRLAVAERVRNAAQSTAAMRDEIAMQDAVNREVAAGNIPAQQAEDLLRQRMADLPLLQAIKAAHDRKDVKGEEEAIAALDAHRIAQDKLTVSRRKGALATAVQAGDDQLAYMREELRLTGATEIVRTRSLAIFRAEQEARGKNWTGPDAAKWVEQQGKIAEAGVINTQASREMNDALRGTADLWDIIAGSASNAARGMADAFGEVGRSIGDAATIMTGYYADQSRLEAEYQASTREMTVGSDAQRREERLFAMRSASLQIGAYGDMTKAAKGFFKEGSSGYKALATAEKVFRAVELGFAIKNAAVQLGLIGGVTAARTVATGTAIATDTAFTATSVANSAVRASADGAAAMAKTAASSPFPFNLAGMAVMAAALASIGVATGFLGGGGKNTLPKANDGTGTVLGDTSAKSESIKRAIDGLKDIDTLMLSSSREMAATLRSIDGQIGNVAALVVRAGDVNASAGVAEGFKTNAVGSVLKAIVPVFGGALASLFGTKTTVVGSGLSAGPQTLGSVLDGGFDASYYSDVQKKKKFLGITTGTSYSTKYNAADAAIENQFTLILKGFNTAIAAAAEPLGETTDTIQRRLNGFVVNLGKIDLQGLTGEEIEEKLSAVFGAAADKMALAAFPGFERFQKVGDGAFETLVRVASTVEAVTASLDMLGGAARGIGIDAKLGLSEQFDSIGDFTSAANAYFETYYTAAEQNAAKVSQLSGVFVRLGVTMPDTLASFRALVDAQDLTTTAGQATYATLLQLAPAFADLKKEMEGAKSAADILAERQDLQRKILELNGDTAAIRALDLAKVDVSNRALQEQVWAIQDAQEAAKNAQTLADAWATVGNSIEDEIRRIRGLSDATGATSFASAFSAFNAATASARAGDQDAAKLLPSLSQALLKVAGDSATSRQELDRVQAQTAASLEATSAVIAALAKGNPLTGAGTIAAAAVAAQAAAPAASSSTNDTTVDIRALRDEIAALRADANAGLAAAAAAGERSARVLERAEGVSGGAGLGVVLLDAAA